MTNEVTTDGIASLSGAGLNPFDYRDLWRYLYLNQLQVPGLVADCAGSNPRKWDKQDGKGQSGATVVYNGDGLAEFSAVIQLGWKGPSLPEPRQQYSDWDQFKVLLRPPTEKNPQALSIYYPNLMLLPVPVVSVVVLDVVGPKFVLPGIAQFEIKFQQYRAAKPAGAKPKGAAADGNKTGGTQDAYDTMIDGLTETLEDL
jgi:hypothetical protein